MRSDGGVPRRTDPYPRHLTALVLSGSRRSKSLNTRLARLAARHLTVIGVEVTLATLAEFDAPNYDQDAEDASGVPESPARLRDLLASSDAFLIVSPEYNASMPGGLKNLVDWVSRYRPQPFHQQHGLLMSASPSMAGGNRGLWALRVPLEHLGARVYPDMFSLARAHEAFDDVGRLRDEGLTSFFESTIEGFVDLVEARTHYPSLKTAWIEFLGEPHSHATARIDAPSQPTPAAPRN
ncbi:NADPH-dependent FMN reductase [Egicoccus sp. AB-alg2]|uniref:NADPH-dependent FMN reductase n=1 Tax=Egicoccus sp. AB-alg2 TaxID=3242693 RepID=UPI00359D8544